MPTLEYEVEQFASFCCPHPRKVGVGAHYCAQCRSLIRMFAIRQWEAGFLTGTERQRKADRALVEEWEELSCANVFNRPKEATAGEALESAPLCLMEQKDA